MVAPYFCNKCKFETGEQLSKCPRCGRALGKTSTIRALGWMLVVVGGGLTAFMVWLTLYITRLIAHSDTPGATTRFTGDESDARFIYIIFGIVLALSLTFVAAGIWQIIYGRRNRKIAFVAVVLLIAFIVIGEYVRYFY